MHFDLIVTLPRYKAGTNRNQNFVSSIEGLCGLCCGANTIAVLSVNGLVYPVRESTLYHTDLVTVSILPPQAR